MRKHYVERERCEISDDDRINFNHGFHDAVHTVRRGWDTKKKNYGFGHMLTINCPDDVADTHYCKPYAVGWTYGYYEALWCRTLNEMDIAKSYPETSSNAWNCAVELGNVAGEKDPT